MTKKTITFSKKVGKILTDLAIKEETTQGDILRRAIALYKYLYTEAEHNDKEIILVDNTGTLAKRIVFG